MSHTATIMKKEIREMLSPGSVASILIMVILFAGMGTMIGGEVEKASTLPEFGIIADQGENAYYFTYGGVDVEWSPLDDLKSMYGNESYKITYLGSPDSIGSIAELMDEKGLTSAIALPSGKDFKESMEDGKQVTVSQYYVYVPTGMFGSVSSTVMSTIVSMLNSDLSDKMVAASGQMDFDFVTSPLVSGDDDTSTVVNGEAHTGVTPYDIASAVSGQTMMIPLVIMIIITMIGSIVIGSMGSEKENKTLETLLTLPIKRTSIVTGKILAAAVVGLIYGLAYMAGMSIYMGSMTGMMSSGADSVDLAALGMSLDLGDWALVMASMFLAIVCALGVCMILGAFSKNYKSAQTMTMPLSILAIIPMFVIMFTGWYGSGAALQAICFAIPFSHPMMAMQALMNGDSTLVLAGIAYMLIFAGATILATVKIYNSDVLITGLGQNKWVQKLTRSR